MSDAATQRYRLMRVDDTGFYYRNLAASKEIDELFEAQHMCGPFNALHFGFQDDGVDAPLQRLTLFYGDTPQIVERNGEWVTAGKNKHISELLLRICTEEHCKTNPEWLPCRNGLAGVCYMAITDPSDEGVWCADMPRGHNERLVRGVHRAELARVAAADTAALVPCDIATVMAQLRETGSSAQTKLTQSLLHGLEAEDIKIQGFEGLSAGMAQYFMNRYLCPDDAVLVGAGLVRCEPSAKQWDEMTTLVISTMRASV